MTTTIKFFLDDVLVGSQSLVLTASPNPVTVSQQVTIGGSNGTLDASFTISENQYTDSGGYSVVEYNRDAFSPGGVARFSGNNVVVRERRKSWKNGAVVHDYETWGSWSDNPLTLYYDRTGSDYDGSFEELNVVEYIELYFETATVCFFTDASLEHPIGAARPILLGQPISLPLNVPVRDPPASGNPPKYVFAGWFNNGAIGPSYSADPDPSADAVSPWPWNPGDEIIVTGIRIMSHTDYSTQVWTINLIVSNPQDRRGGKRRKSFYADTEWDEDDHLCVAIYACWHSCTGKLIRDASGNLVRDAATGLPLIDL